MAFDPTKHGATEIFSPESHGAVAVGQEDIYASMEDKSEVSKVAKGVFNFSTDTSLPLSVSENLFPILEEFSQTNVFKERIDSVLNGTPVKDDGIVFTPQPIDPDRPGLFKRGLKKFGRSFVNTMAAIRTESEFGQTLTELGVLGERIQEAKDAGLIPEDAGLKSYIALTDAVTDVLHGGESIEDQIERKKQERVVGTAGFKATATPEAVGVKERAADIAGNIAGFVAKLAITKQALGPAAAGRNILAWELLNQADNGIPGAGAAMYVALRGIDKIPIQGAKGFFTKTGSQSAVFAGSTAAAGGDAEAVATAALIPWALRGFDAAVKSGVSRNKARIMDRAVKNLRETGIGNKTDLKGVPDSSLKFIINSSRKAEFWNKQFEKGKITEDVLDFRLNQIRKEVGPTLAAIAKQQRAVAKETAIVPAGKPVTTEPPIEPTQVPPKTVAKPVEIAAKKAKLKEAVAIDVAKEKLRLKTQPSKAVKPTKIITKKEALSLKESNLITGEGDKIRVVPDAQTRRSIQAKENEIAKLKTRRNELVAEKQFAVAKTKAQEIAKKEIALATLKEKAGIKLEQTIEGSRVKIAKIKDAIEFKDSLRDDAISMIASIPVELRAGFVNRAAKVKTLKGVQKLAKEIEVGVEKFERKVAISDLNKVIGKIESEIDTLPSPQREKLISAIDSVSTKKISKEPIKGVPREFEELDVKARAGRKQLLGKDLESLQKTTQKLASELAGQLESLEPEVEASLRIPNERVRQLNLLTQKNANEISVEDIKFISESLQNTFHEAKVKGKLLVRKGLKPLEGTLKTAPTEIRSTKKAVAEKAKILKGEEIDPSRGVVEKLVGGANKLVRLDEMHSDTLIERVTLRGAKDVPLILDTLPHKGLRETAQTFNKWRKKTSKAFEAAGFNDLKQLLGEHTVRLTGVNIKKVTLSELMSLEMDTRSPDNLLQRLNADGIRIRDKTFKYPKNADGEDTVDRLKEIRDAVAIVRKNKMAMVILDHAEKLNNQDQAPAVNEMAKLRFGHEIARDEHYYPRSRVGDGRVSGPKGKISIPPERIGRYQQRTGGTLPIKLRPWHEVFLEGIEADAAFANMTLPLRNARILLDDKVFRNSMIESGREPELRNLTEIFANAQGITTSKDIVDVYGSFILKNRTTSALGFRISTRGTQIMSFYAAQAETGSQGAFVIKPYGKASIDRIEEDSDLMDLRWTSRRVGVEVGTNASDDAFDLLFFGKTKSLQNKGMKGLVAGDKQALANIYYQLVVPEIGTRVRNGKNVDPFEWEGQDVADLPVMSDVDSAAFRYAAARRLEYVTRRTQPMFDTLDRSVSMSSSNFFRRSFLMFRTALNAQGNVVERALIQFQKDEINKKQLTGKVGAVAASLTAVSLWKRGLKFAIKTGVTSLLAAIGIFQFKEPKEKKDIAKSILEDTAKGISSLNPFTKLLANAIEITVDKVAGDKYPWGREPVENPVLEVINSGADSVVNVTQAIVNVKLLDEFVEERTDADRRHNQILRDKLVNDLELAIRSSWDFGTTITGAPLQAPVQEFIEPLFKESSIGIIREVTFEDVKDPQKFSEGVFELYEKRKELTKKSKSKRLNLKEEKNLRVLNKFADDMGEITATLKQTQQHNTRKLRFLEAQMKVNSTNASVGER